jgi:hypothetical protein
MAFHTMPNHPAHPAALSPDELLKQCDIRFLRRSGPGGQHRNKVSTAVALVHRPTGVQAEASERRSQAENRTESIFRLRVNLALAIRGNCELGSMPSALWQSRLGGGRIDLSPTHDDFPSLLAEAIDVLAENEYDPRPASQRLDCSASQLIKLLKKEPRAIALVNEERRRRGLHSLR